MSAFVRRFTFDPGNQVLLEIEAVNILDLEPPEPIAGVGSGMALCVGEFENGPFATPYQVLSGGDLRTTFGDFGYVYGSLVAQNPCARSRKADNAVNAASGIQATRGCDCAEQQDLRSADDLPRNTSCRATASFSREASLLGSAKVAYSLITGQHLDVDIGAGSVVATFTGAVATHTGSSAAFGSIAAGDTVTLGYDAASNFVVTFLAGDTTIANVVARINQYAGFTFASNAFWPARATGCQGARAQAQAVVAGL